MVHMFSSTVTVPKKIETVLSSIGDFPGKNISRHCHCSSYPSRPEDAGNTEADVGLSLLKSLQVWTTVSTCYEAHINFNIMLLLWPPLWSRGHSSWLQTHRSRVWFPTLPHFVSSSGSGTGSTQPREHKWGATWKKSSGSGLEYRY
jgi:hypothetical protein